MNATHASTTSSRLRSGHNSRFVSAKVAVLALALALPLQIAAQPGAATPLHAAGKNQEPKVFDCRKLVVKPSTLNLTCDGPPTFLIDGETLDGSGGKLTKLKWKSWGSTNATGTGTLALSRRADANKGDAKSPTGIIVYQRMKVNVTLGKPRQRSGERVFTEAVTTKGPDFEVNTWPLKTK